MRLASTRALVRYIIAAPIASFWSSPMRRPRRVPVPGEARLARADVEVDRHLAVGARFPQRVPRAIHRGRGDPAAAGRSSMLTPRSPRCRDPLGFARSTASMSHDGSSAIGYSRPPDSRPASRPSRRCRASRDSSRSSGSATSAKLLATEAGDVRVDDLGPDADLVHHREPGRHVVGRGVGVVERPADERRCRDTVRRRGARRSTRSPGSGRRPSIIHDGSPSTSTTCGTRSSKPRGARRSRGRGAR